MQTKDYTEKVIDACSSNEMNIFYVGKRIKSKNHFINNQIKNHFMFVFAEEGTAKIYGNNTISFSKNDLFVVFPKKAWSYRADSEWSNYWIGICGQNIECMLKDAGITRENPLLHIKNPYRIKKYSKIFMNYPVIKVPMQECQLFRKYMSFFQYYSRICKVI